MRYNPLDYLDIKQTYFVSHRANCGYYLDHKALIYPPDSDILSTLNKETRKDTDEKDSYLVENPKTTQLLEASPLEEEPLLFTKFAAISTAADMLDFANAHGLLYSPPPSFEEKEAAYNINSNTFRHIEPPYQQLITPRYCKPKNVWSQDNIQTIEWHGKAYGIVYGESFDLWQSEINLLKNVLTVSEMLRSEDIKGLRGIFCWQLDFNRKYLLINTDIIKEIGGDLTKGLASLLAQQTIHELPDINFRCQSFTDVKTKEYFDDDTFAVARFYMIQQVNKKLAGNVNPVISENKKKRFTPYLNPNNLLTAMWLQLYQSITGEIKYKRCEVCGIPADSSNKKSNWRMHTECANRLRQRKFRENKAREK